MPAASTVLPAPTGARMTRDGLLALERSGDAWRFMPLAMQALEQSPADVELRLTLIVALARLGLSTLALEHFHALPQAEQSKGELPQLHDVLDQGAGRDVLSPRRALRRAQANVDALAERSVDLTDALARFRRRAADVERFVAEDGNVVRRRPDRQGFAAFLRFADEMGAAGSVELPHLDRQRKPKLVAEVRPYLVDGLDPPFLLERVWRETPLASDGHQPWIACFADDEDACLDGLALADLRPVIRDPRVFFFIGAGAADDLARFLDERDSTTLQCVLLELPVRRPRSAERSPERVIDAALARQSRKGQQLRQRMDDIYQARDRAWWARRFAAALRSVEDSEQDASDTGVDASPLRVLIPTCRYSTFIQHSAADLARAFEDIGCQARILIEPDHHSRMTQLAYLRACVDFQPDLIVLINYTRDYLKEAMPANIPFVCWIQDRMPHLFDEKLGISQGEFDFVLGHTYGELFKRYRWPRERAWRFPVAVSERKFHPGPVDAELRERFECDVAYMTNQSEPPEAMRRRLAASADGPFRQVLDAIFHEMPAALERQPLAPVPAVAHQLVAALADEYDPDRRLDYFALRNNYAFPLAERIVRFQTAQWLVDLAEAQGWRLRLYGRGWEHQPAFARFAAGPVDHEREARAAYQCAAVHIHASGDTSAHQRVFECYLSGGLPLRRLAAADLDTIECELARRRLVHLVEQGADPASVDPYVAETSCALGRRLLELWQRTGASSVLPQKRQQAIREVASLERADLSDASVRKRIEQQGLAKAQRWIRELTSPPLETLPDVALPRPWETLFWSRDTLAQRLERILQASDHRQALIEEGQRMIRERLTLSGLSRQLLRFVSQSLSRDSAQAPTPVEAVHARL